MNSTEVCASEDADAEKQHTNIYSTQRNTKSSGRQYVNVLLDLSEEGCSREYNIHLLQSRTVWEDAVEGWGRFPPLGEFLQPPRKGKKIKQDTIDSHCLLCADLNLSDLPIYCSAGNALQTFRSFSVLPPVKESRNQRNYSLFKKVEPTDCHPAEVVTKAMMPDAAGAVTDGKILCVNDDTGNVFKALVDFIPEENGYWLKGPPSTKHWLSQVKNHTV